MDTFHFVWNAATSYTTLTRSLSKEQETNTIQIDANSTPKKEIMEWIGWAVLTWSLAGLTFVIWTTANLLPRAVSHHKWYKEEFEDYPENRKALIPFIL